MEFKLRYYNTPGGSIPVEEFLQSLRTSEKVLHKLLVAGLKKLRDSQNHGPPLTSWADRKQKIYELRVGGVNIARVFFFFRQGQEIILTNGYVKKGQKADPQQVDRARRYKRDWEERYP